MHYKDGTEAQLYDIVRGKGYNLPYEITGPVLGLTPNAGSCNIKVGATVIGDYGQAPAGYGTHQPLVMFNPPAAGVVLRDDKLFAVQVYVEAGTCGDFELVHRPVKQPNGIYK